MKYMRYVVFAAVIAVMTSISAFAADVDMGSVMADAFTGMVADVLTSMGLIIPIALGIFGALFAAKMGMKIFKSFTTGGAAQ